jgi:hypothetical protein
VVAFGATNASKFLVALSAIFGVAIPLVFVVPAGPAFVVSASSTPIAMNGPPGTLMSHRR